MKISQMIQELQEIMKVEGDIPVFIFDADYEATSANPIHVKDIAEIFEQPSDRDGITGKIVIIG